MFINKIYKYLQQVQEILQRKSTIKKLTISSSILFIIVILLVIWCSNQSNNVCISSNTSTQNPIKNFSVEEMNTDNLNMPENWNQNCWGDNSTTFTYLDSGYSSEHSLKVEVKDYKDGDAKWFFNPIHLEPEDYLFSNYYKSDVDTRVVAAFTIMSGDIKYIDLPVAFASDDWTKYEASFTVPNYAQSVSIYHLLSDNGYLIVDDYQIDAYNYEGFNNGMVTITFDDGWEENIETALPILQEFGYKTNQFYATTYIENPMVLNPKEYIQLFIDDGHEIGSHSVTHPYLTTLPEEEVTFELLNSKSYLEDYLGIEVKYFATPYGDFNKAVNDEIMNYYSAHRTATEFGYNSKDNLDVSRLKSQSILCTTSIREFERWVSKAKDEKLWLILLYHRVSNHPNEYDVPIDNFYQQMQVIEDSGLPVVTFTQAFDEIFIE